MYKIKNRNTTEVIHLDILKLCLDKDLPNCVIEIRDQSKSVYNEALLVTGLETSRHCDVNVGDGMVKEMLRGQGRQSGSVSDNDGLMILI